MPVYVEVCPLILWLLRSSSLTSGVTGQASTLYIIKSYYFGYYRILTVLTKIHVICTWDYKNPRIKKMIKDMTGSVSSARIKGVPTDNIHIVIIH